MINLSIITCNKVINNVPSASPIYFRILPLIGERTQKIPQSWWGPSVLFLNAVVSHAVLVFVIPCEEVGILGSDHLLA